VRKGFGTTNREKLAACSKFKNLVEHGKITINSKNLLSEMKTFGAVGGGYKAKFGQTDDLVLATLLIVRMSQQLAQWDTDIFEKMRESINDEIAPMPIWIIR